MDTSGEETFEYLTYFAIAVLAISVILSLLLLTYRFVFQQVSNHLA